MKLEDALLRFIDPVRILGYFKGYLDLRHSFCLHSLDTKLILGQTSHQTCLPGITFSNDDHFELLSLIWRRIIVELCWFRAVKKELWSN